MPVTRLSQGPWQKPVAWPPNKEKPWFGQGSHWGDRKRRGTDRCIILCVFFTHLRYNSDGVGGNVTLCLLPSQITTFSLFSSSDFLVHSIVLMCAGVVACGKLSRWVTSHNVYFGFYFKKNFVIYNLTFIDRKIDLKAFKCLKYTNKQIFFWP